MKYSELFPKLRKTGLKITVHAGGVYSVFKQLSHGLVTRKGGGGSSDPLHVVNCDMQVMLYAKTKCTNLMKILL